MSLISLEISVLQFVVNPFKKSTENNYQSIFTETIVIEHHTRSSATFINNKRLMSVKTIFKYEASEETHVSNHRIQAIHVILEKSPDK